MTLKRRFHWLAIVGGAILIDPLTIFAISRITIQDNTLLTQSDVIVVGRLIPKTVSHEDNNGASIYYATLAVDEVLRGKIARKPVRVAFIHGLHLIVDGRSISPRIGIGPKVNAPPLAVMDTSSIIYPQNLDDVTVSKIWFLREIRELAGKKVDPKEFVVDHPAYIQPLHLKDYIAARAQGAPISRMVEMVNRHPDERVRKRAMEYFKDLTNPMMMVHLEPLLQSSLQGVRLAAAQIMAEKGKGMVTGAMIKALDHDDLKVRLVACTYFVEPYSQFVPIEKLGKTIRDLPGEAGVERMRAVEAMSQVKSRDLVPYLLDLFNEESMYIANTARWSLQHRLGIEFPLQSDRAKAMWKELSAYSDEMIRLAISEDATSRTIPSVQEIRRILRNQEMIHLELALNTTEVTNTTVLTATCTISNMSSWPLVIAQRPNLEFFCWQTFFAGQGEGSRGWRMDDWKVGVHKEDYVTLHPGEYIQWAVPIRSSPKDDFRYFGPGNREASVYVKYDRLGGQFGFNAWRGELTSNSVSFRYIDR